MNDAHPIMAAIKLAYCRLLLALCFGLSFPFRGFAVALRLLAATSGIALLLLDRFSVCQNQPKYGANSKGGPNMSVREGSTMYLDKGLNWYI